MKHYVLQDLRCGSYITSTGSPASYGMSYIGTSSMYSSDYNLGFGDWTKDYQTIADCNLILEKVATMTDAQLSEASDPVAYRNKILGEALFIRAYTYFTMVQYWGDVPLVTTYYDDVLNALQLPRTNKDSVLSLVESDCLSAVDKLDWPSSYSSSQLAVRATKGSVYALLANLYLWEGTVHELSSTANDLTLINKAGAYIDTVINSNQYTLIDTANYLSAYAGNSKESIFEINMLSTDNEGTQYHYALSFLQGTPYAPTLTTSPYFYYNPGLLGTIFSAADTLVDIRYKHGFYYDKRTSTYRLVPLKYSTLTYPSSTSTTTVVVNNNMVVYRLEALKLLKAEVDIYNGDYASALDILNANRKRNGYSTALTLPTSNVYVTMIKYYMTERVKECFFEGTLFNDMIRTKAFGSSYSSYFTSWMTSSIYDEGGYYLPIYPNLFLNNPYLVQNNYYLGKI
ncbi:MAG: RagB/SusD family nutrient uptake outer membrane protein [Arachidicoccus sp.]|nr:RagB/SusD family nutrient uptake outer membrane protein [Arachidicoccus sp.]